MRRCPVNRKPCTLGRCSLNADCPVFRDWLHHPDGAIKAITFNEYVRELRKAQCRQPDKLEHVKD
jgi:hypothetical protein